MQTLEHCLGRGAGRGDCSSRPIAAEAGLRDQGELRAGIVGRCSVCGCVCVCPPNLDDSRRDGGWGEVEGHVQYRMYECTDRYGRW